MLFNKIIQNIPIKNYAKIVNFHKYLLILLT